MLALSARLSPRRIRKSNSIRICTRRAISSTSERRLNIGLDSKTKLIHSAEATPANVHDSKVEGDLLQG